jgi:hypothetical protein
MTHSEWTERKAALAERLYRGECGGSYLVRGLHRDMGLLGGQLDRIEQLLRDRRD